MAANTTSRSRIEAGAGVRQGAALLAVAGLCMLANRADAQEFCVNCAEPAAVYRCVIDGAQPGGSQPLQGMCISAMAKEGGHASCSLKRGTVFDCDGPVKRISWSAYSKAAAAPAQGTGAPKQEQAAPSAKTAEPPPTIEEMAKRAGGQAADQAKSVGQKMGEAGKKTWTCIASLFTRCGE